jgi:hypothetical protein
MVLKIGLPSIRGLLPALVECPFVLIINGLSFKKFVNSQYYFVQDPWIITKQDQYVFNSIKFSIQFLIY